MGDRVPIVDLDLIEDRVLLDRKVKIADHVQRDRIADHVLHVQRVKTVDLDQKDKIVRKELRQ
jgi:transketolase C-terminal domain/subunit